MNRNKGGSIFAVLGIAAVVLAGVSTFALVFALAEMSRLSKEVKSLREAIVG